MYTGTARMATVRPSAPACTAVGDDRGGGLARGVVSEPTGTLWDRNLADRCCDAPKPSSSLPASPPALELAPSSSAPSDAACARAAPPRASPRLVLATGTPLASCPVPPLASGGHGAGPSGLDGLAVRARRWYKCSVPCMSLTTPVTKRRESPRPARAHVSSLLPPSPPRPPVLSAWKGPNTLGSGSLGAAICGDGVTRDGLACCPPRGCEAPAAGLVAGTGTTTSGSSPSDAIPAVATPHARASRGTVGPCAATVKLCENRVCDSWENILPDFVGAWLTLRAPSSFGVCALHARQSTTRTRACSFVRQV